MTTPFVRDALDNLARVSPADVATAASYVSPAMLSHIPRALVGDADPQPDSNRAAGLCLRILATNVAFMQFAFARDVEAARVHARLALQHASPPGTDVWKTATVAEASLYLDRVPEALAEYRRLLTLDAEAWKHRSASLQAARIAAVRGDRALAEELESIFTPGARRVNQIFVSYSHRDAAWLERLKKMVALYLRAAETELVLWDDTRLRAGQQ